MDLLPELIKDLTEKLTSYEETFYKIFRYKNYKFYEKKAGEIMRELRGLKLKLDKIIPSILDEKKEKVEEISNLVSKIINSNIQVQEEFFLIIENIKDIIQDLEIEFEDTNSRESNIFYITGETPWTDRNKKFLDFIKKLEGEIIILEPHYGLGTFYVLDNFGKKQEVKFLTSQLGTSENQDKISKELIRFKKEFPNIKLKKYSKFYELHDRYIISNNFLVWIGHGIKDIGDKESFLIAIPANEVSEVIKNLKQRFEEKWSKSNNLT